ncbi:hypothetical protein IZ6_23160 [Terrihabitans soli]|uniref:DUF1476 domain-containing protein n=1 Tax=Terrihabitans soli TaxID=708113 RepID=A0A6S6QX15_9HYPH|nr:DUF1476 domain-containing protein [Terrihabitans soli]BCJ91581.1 hypothetical protein IZ6_23160 [Terrihabitans soli]
MTTFDDREAAFERKFVLDEDQRFRATARRNRLLGEWAAAKQGKSGDEAAAYAKTVVAADFAEAGDEDVFKKVRSDLPASVSDDEIRSTMLDLLEKAATEVKAAG